MDINAYAIEHKIQANHWWFVIRRRLFANIIKQLQISQNAPTLDVGVSTGTNLKMLTELGFNNFTGLDMSKESIKFCAEQGFCCVKQGNICSMPFQDNTFELVLATDIIEHVDDDLTAVSEIQRVMKPGGKAIITVPAFQTLWGPQDELSFHKRRYRLKSLLNLIQRTGLVTVESYYFNYILFLPILITRKLLNLIPNKVQSENNINSPFINKLLTKIFYLDITSAAKLKPPFGVSALAIVSKHGAKNERKI